MITITEFPYSTQINLINDSNLSIHAYNGSGDNEITIRQGNMPEAEKASLVQVVEVLEGDGNVVAISGHLTKYLFLDITGDGALEIEYHVNRQSN